MEKVDLWIKDNVKGKTFLDVGPVWETVFEKLSTAHMFGASEVVALDMFPSDHPLWNAFHERMKEKAVPYQWVSSNVFDYNGIHDVVYCSGVIYHCPNPLGMLAKLRSLVRETLILQSTVTPEKLNTKAGKMTIPTGAMLFVPALKGKEKEIVSEYWFPILGGRPSGGLTNVQNFDVNNEWNWWWLFTPATLDAMCKAAGFVVRSSVLTGHRYKLLLGV